MVKWLLVCALLLCQTAAATAQIVRGHVTEVDTKTPLQGVFVVLQDSTGRMRAGVLSDAQGYFVIVSPVTGRISLRAERIGHRDMSSGPVILTAGQTQTVDLQIPVAAIELAPLDVAADTRCVLRANQGMRAAQLWEEARKALSVTSWMERRKGTQFVARSYTRELDVASLHVLNESVQLLMSGNRPYAAISADSAMRYGFVQRHADGMTFYGPDAELLLSDEFLDRHCFYTTKGAGTNEGFVGLAFQPTAQTKLPTIKGTLWLDATSLELKHIDYEFANLPREFRVRGTGGRTEFRRLASGAWFVGRWYIRMPTVISGRERGYRPVQMKETGGEVLSLRDPEVGTDFGHVGSVLYGMVYDSIARRPLSGATVYLSGTAQRTTTDADGRYRLSDVRDGRYNAAFIHPVLDSLPAASVTQSVALTGDSVFLQLSIPTGRNLLAQLCSGTKDTAGAVYGYVRDQAGNTVADARLHVRYRNTILPATTNASGYYLVCGVPENVPLDVRAFTTNHESGIVAIKLSGKPFKRVDLRLKN
ncbi:MAG TPA: carboxypeptidase regulatory-like domain-containing protein [Longimicrobiales bacterium]